MAFTHDYKYVDLAGLGEFKSQLLTKLAANTASSYTVNHSLESDKLATTRSISFATGDVTGSFNFDGSANVSDVALSIGEGKVTNAMLAGSIAQSKILGTGEGKTLADDLGSKVDKVTGYGLSKNDFTDELKTKLDNIEAGGQVNVIETVKVNGSALEVTDKAVDVTVVEGSTNGTIAVNGTDVAVHGLGGAAYTATSAYTSAEDGAAMDERIKNLEARGRFLSTWDCSTGLPETDPPESALVEGKYNYKSGDYYVVGKVSSATPAVNYKPSGSSYTPKTASTTVEPNTKVAVGDFYLYDGTNWKLLENTQKTITIAQVEGLQTALDSKVVNTTTVNGHALSADVTVDGSDVALTGYVKGTSSAAIAATDTINAAFGKVENQIDAEATARDTAISTAIAGLDATVGSTTVETGKHVAVQVVEENGKLTGCTVTESDIASAALLGTTSDAKTSATAFGYIAKEASDRADADSALSTAISAEETRATGVESGLDTRLTTAEGNITTLSSSSHSHSNKALLDTYTQTEADLADAVSKKHSHSNKSELDLIASGDKAKWDAKYDKPSTGIPKTDLAEAVQTSLGKADSAVQKVEDGTSATGNGTIKVDGVAVNVYGLKSAAYTESSAYDAAGTAAAAIAELDATVSQTAAAGNGGLALSVVQTDGKLTSVSGSITTATQSEINALFA